MFYGIDPGLIKYIIEEQLTETKYSHIADNIKLESVNVTKLEDIKSIMDVYKLGMWLNFSFLGEYDKKEVERCLNEILDKGVMDGLKNYTGSTNTKMTSKQFNELFKNE